MESFLSLFGPSDDKPPRSGTGKENERSLVQLCFGEHTKLKCLPPEPQVGNIEYKLKLINPNPNRFEHLVTQMKWRLREGQGVAVYEIGVEDSGFLRGLNSEEMAISLDTLNKMAIKLGATMTVLSKNIIPGSEDNVKTVAEVLIRKISNPHTSIELRVAVFGSANAGKSTLLGVLTNGQMDDGRGRARLNMFRHLHEIQSGRTSSISHEVLGFDKNGRTINYKEGGSETICELSTKLITLIDLAGHHKYLRTTIGGITGYCPHYILFVISNATGFNEKTKEHFTLALALEVPLIIVITKIDLTVHLQLEGTLADLQSHMLSLGYKGILPVRSEDEVVDLCSNGIKDRQIPVFFVSCVNGQGMQLLIKLLQVLPPVLNINEGEVLAQELPEFQVDETFRIPGGPTILGGLLTKGTLSEGSSLLLGPLRDGNFIPVFVTSIRRHKIPCLSLNAGQSASIGLNIEVEGLRKGLVLLSPFSNPTACISFQANISVLHHATSMSKGFQTTVHIANVMQTVVIEEILLLSRLATNDTASVKFRFIQHPEYINVGSRLLFREGSSTIGSGTVTEIFPVTTPVSSPNGSVKNAR